MTTLEWALQALLVLALGAALPGVVRLERALSALGRDRADLVAAARQLADAVGEAEAAMVRLRSTADRAGRGMADQAAAAGRVGDDLRFLVERAEAEADRLDRTVRSSRVQHAASPADSRPEPRSEHRPEPWPESAPTGDTKAEPATAALSRARAEEGVLRVFRGIMP